MVNITHNPTINLFCFYAPPMGYSFNLFLHHPLIPPWTDKRVATLQIFTLLYLIDFTLLGKLLLCIWVYLIKKINYGSLTGQLMYQSNRSLNIPGQPPGHLNFWKIFVQIPPSRG